MDVEKCVTIGCLFKKITFLPFFQPFLAPKLFKLSVKFFFNDLGLTNWSMNMQLTLYLLAKAFFYA